MTTPTRRQREIYDFVRDFINLRGYSPTVFDIASHFNLRATSTVTEHLKSLENLGLIKRGTKNALIQLPTQTKPSSMLGLPNLEETQIEKPPTMVAIPFYGKIAAGEPLEVNNDTTETVYVPPEFTTGNCYALRACGDSMIEDGILDGDLLVIRQSRQAEQGQTIVALVEKKAATVKRFFRQGYKIILEPANQRLRPLTLRPNQLEIQGVVKAILRIY